MEPVPSEYQDLFEKPSIAYVATLLPDGTPHVTPTWIDFDGENLLVNTIRDNRKDRNVRDDPRITVAVADPENPYRYLSVRGEVVERREENAREHLDAIAERYTGQPTYPGPSGERVVLVIRPDAVSGQSPPRRSE
ncbi:PPOX class F420-dependent oxidoreductase [Halorarius litoreus]|uniref:PPOX class F420-dependent oxidoreductase n=1 Tax=Halorarius litoreus TaxID=2962676 RepID=UPI0020CD06BD|nr:PPOX class F420-dependent oxidoreductase [Halorarius litoreus]